MESCGVDAWCLTISTYPHSNIAPEFERTVPTVESPAPELILWLHPVARVGLKIEDAHNHFDEKNREIWESDDIWQTFT